MPKKAGDEMAHVLDAVIRLKDNFTDTIQRVEKSVGDFSRTYKRMGRDIQRTGKTISGIGKTLTATVTMPLIGLGTAAIKLGMDFEAGMSQVQALTGATAQEMKQLSDMAKHLGETTIFSAKEAAEGMAFLGMAGFEVSEIMDSMPGLLDLAAASNMELGRAADIVTNILSGFGMKAAEAGRVADVLAKGASSANTSVEQLGGAMKYVAPVAASLGLKIEDLTAAVGFMSDAGIQGEQAGRQLRQGLLRLANPTGEAAKLIDKLGIEAFNADGSMKTLDKVVSELEKSLGKMDDKTRSAALATLFGAESVAGWTALIQRGSEELAAYTKELENAEGAAKEMADIMQDNLQGQLTMLKSQLEGVALELAEVLIPVVSQGVSKISEFIDRIKNMDDGTKETIKQVAKFAAILGPSLLIIGKMTTGVGRLVTEFGFFAGRVKSLGLMGAIFTPGVKVFLILSAIAAAVILLIKNWDKIKAKAKEVFPGIEQQIATTMEHVKNIFNGVVNALKIAWGLVAPIFTIGWEVIKSVFIEGLSFIGNIIGNVIQVISGIVDFITGVFTGNWELAWQGITNIFESVFGAIETIAKGIMNGVIGVINGVIGGLNKIKIPDWVPGIGGKGINIPLIPKLAKGTDYWKGGIAQVHERGGEIIDLPKGSRVYPHDKSVQMAREQGQREGSKVNNINIPKLADTIVVREEADIDKIANAIVRKIEKASLNMA